MECFTSFINSILRFKELVTEFNRRYDKQNNSLLTVLDDDDDKPLQKEQKDAFIDYFNLCSEEYLFYQIGYIRASLGSMV